MLRDVIDRRFSFLSDQPVLPLVLLLCLSAIAALEAGAFLSIWIETRVARGSLAEAAVVSGLSSLTAAVGGVLVGALGDRAPRPKLLTGAVVVWAVASMFTGFAGALWLLLGLRLLAGIAKVAAGPVHASLLADLYPEQVQGRVFAAHYAAVPAGFLAGRSLAPLVEEIIGDRRFVLIAPAALALLLGAACWRLTNPDRGETQNFALAAVAALEPPVPLTRSLPQLFASKGLKRIYAAMFFAGGALPLFPFLSRFFRDIFGLNAVQIWPIGVVNAVLQLMALIFGGVMTDRLRRASLANVASLGGASIALAAAGLVLAGISESFLVAVAGSFIASLGIGVSIVPAVSLLSTLIPARIRSLGLGLSASLLGLGGLLFTLLVQITARGQGLRPTVTSLAPTLVVAGLLFVLSGRYLERDSLAALETLTMEAQLAQERVSGAQSPRLSK